MMVTSKLAVARTLAPTLLLLLLVLVLLLFLPSPVCCGLGEVVENAPLAQVDHLANGLPRDVINFNYGWRFHFGHAPDGQAGPPGCTFKNISGPLTCTGYNNNPNRFSAQDCQRACCYNPECRLWFHHFKYCFHGGQNASCQPAGPNATVYSAGVRQSCPPLLKKYAFAEKTFDDSGWPIVDAPHDFIIANSHFSPEANKFHGHLLRNVSWYRKHFRLPREWKGSTIYLYFEGVFHYTQVWLNGAFLQSHACGYTGFTVRIDNTTHLHYDPNGENVLTLRVDASFGSGHWYEGGGIYRPVHLIRTSASHIVHDGLFVHSEGDGDAIPVSAEVETHGSTAASVRAVFTLRSSSGTILASHTSSPLSLQPGASFIVNATLHPTATITPWSIATPALYTVTAALMDASNTQHTHDAVNITTGFRTTRWSADSGFYLNQQHMKFRGFSNHNSFAGVGVAMPERLNLFRVQSMRALGGNIWRMSHNPYAPSLYALLDTLGILVWDENRNYGPEYALDMCDMVKRDRNHPSIIIFSFCNEYECEQQTNETSTLFRQAAKSMDPTRPVGANGPTFSLDVQGFSHRKAHVFEHFHKEHPNTPSVLSECCSCTSQRNDKPRTIPECPCQQNAPGLLPFVTGSLGVWTLMDYYGEPPGKWPAVSSSFGQFDLAGFPKPHAWWYRINWLALEDSATAPGRPPLPSLHASRVISLLDSLAPAAVTEAAAPENSSRNAHAQNGPPVHPSSSSSSSLRSALGAVHIHTISSSNASELFVDGKSVAGVHKGGRGEQVAWAVPVPRNVSCPCTLPITADVQCRGLSKADSATTAKACRKACCARPTCTVWQFAEGHGCWVGQYDPSSCFPGHAGKWTGEATAGPRCSLFDNVTVVGRSAAGSEESRHTVLGTAGPPTALQLFLDAPSPATGTGVALALDGADAALVRAVLVDEDGRIATQHAVNVTFHVAKGPGRIVGTGNGDPRCLQPPQSATMPTYAGVARAVVQVTRDCLSADRETLQLVDVDGGQRTRVSLHCSAEDIVLRALAPNVTSTHISIPALPDPKMKPLEVARQSLHMDYTYMDDYQG